MLALPISPAQASRDDRSDGAHALPPADILSSYCPGWCTGEKSWSVARPDVRSAGRPDPSQHPAARLHGAQRRSASWHDLRDRPSPTVLEHVRILEETRLLTTEKAGRSGSGRSAQNASMKLGNGSRRFACGNGGSTGSTATSRLARGDAGEPGNRLQRWFEAPPDVVFDA